MDITILHNLPSYGYGKMNPRTQNLPQNHLFLRQHDKKPVEWLVCDQSVDYKTAHEIMEKRAAQIANNKACECVWLLEHPPLYTAGTSARETDLIVPDRFPVFQTGRGGQYTYHGPGQRVAYVMLDLKARKQDVRLFVAALEDWLIATLERFNIKGERRDERVGVWVSRPDHPSLPNGTAAEDKIAALGIRLRKWVSFHGVSLNINPDLDHFDGINACGIKDYGVTSFEDLGFLVSMAEVDIVMKQSFEEIFGPAEHSLLTQTP